MNKLAKSTHAHIHVASIGHNHALRSLDLIAKLHTVAIGVHVRVAVLVLCILAKVQESLSTGSVRHFAAIGIIIRLPVALHLTVGDTIRKGVGKGVESRVQASHPIDNLSAARVRASVVASGTSLSVDHCGKQAEQSDGEKDAHLKNSN